MPLLRESFERPAKLRSFFRTHGCLSVCGSPADSTHSSAPLRWLSSVRRFHGAVANTIFLAVRSATTPDSSSAGAPGFPPAAPRLSPLSSPSTAALSFRHLPATQKSFPPPSSSDLAFFNGPASAGAARRKSQPERLRPPHE